MNESNQSTNDHLHESPVIYKLADKT